MKSLTASEAGGDDLVALGDVHRHRLLKEHMLAGFERGDRAFDVAAVRDRHRDRIDV